MGSMYEITVDALPYEWVRVDRHIKMTGDTKNAIDDRIASGEWAEGKNYTRTGPRMLWINVIEFNKWVKSHRVPAQQPPSPKA